MTYLLAQILTRQNAAARQREDVARRRGRDGEVCGVFRLFRFFIFISTPYEGSLFSRRRSHTHLSIRASTDIRSSIGRFHPTCSITHTYTHSYTYVFPCTYVSNLKCDYWGDVLRGSDACVEMDIRIANTRMAKEGRAGRRRRQRRRLDGCH